MIHQVVNAFRQATAGGITFVGGKSSVFTGTGSPTAVSLTDLTGGLATQPSANDLVVASFAYYATDTNLSITGYSEQCDLYGGDRSNLGVYTKVMGGTPDTSLTVSATTDANAQTMVRVLVFRGVDTATPMDVAATAGTVLNDGSIIIPAITPLTNGAILIGTGCAQAGNVLNVLEPDNIASGYTDFLVSKSGRLTSCIGWKPWAGGTAGPYNLGGPASSVTDMAACALALRPA